MISSCQSMKPEPDIYIVIPPPIYKDGVFTSNQNLVNNIYPDLIRQICSLSGIKNDRIIDMFSIMGGKDLSMSHLFIDGYHPNSDGYKHMAKHLFLHIFKVSNLDIDDMLL